MSFASSQLTLQSSLVKGKRYTLVNGDGRRVSFGQRGGRTYIDHESRTLKRAWVARHKHDKGFNDRSSGIFYARMLLWGPETSMRANIHSLKLTHGIDIRWP
jgi:hypothetical protein